MKLENLDKLVDSYHLTPHAKHNGDNLYLKCRKQEDGSDGWFIGNDSDRCSLNADLLLFCFEPSNSEKDDNFFKEHRFSTKEEALKILEKYLNCNWEHLKLTENELRHYKRQRDIYKAGLADLF